MTTTREKKKEIVTKYQKHKNDTGSPEVQIALLTGRINHLTNHLATNPKDFQSQRGLLQMVGNRKSYLNYLKEKDIESHRRIVDTLGIRS